MHSLISNHTKRDPNGAMTPSNESLFLGELKKTLVLCQAWLWHENGLFSKVYMILFMMTLYLCVIFNFVYIWQEWGDSIVLSQMMPMAFSQASVCFKATVFIVNQDLLVTLLNTMKSEVFQPQNQKIVKAASQNTRKLCIFFLSSTFTTTTLCLLVAHSNKAGVRAFPLKIWMPVSPESSPGYELGYLYQVVAMYISTAYFSGIDLLILCMILFGCAQIDVIFDRLKQVQSIPVNMKNRKDRDELMKRNNELLVECIRRHQAVARFIQNLENAYHSNIFFQLIGTVAIICFIGYNITLVNDTKSMHFFFMCNHMVTMLMQLYLFCWAGNKITEKSEILRDHLYLCPWYDQDIKYRRTMLIAMECMKKPIIFRAGHYVPLSRPTFVSILRASYSYFAFLNERRDK